MAGRDRETSASYYTPESLTRLTVQLTLRERLDQNDEITPARELLEWTICEPALGSGAFLNEAINQVAAEYLKRAQKERGEELDPERYAEELQKVKAYIALHRSYGVDLNETAVELAEVSLWLNVMYPGLQAPWFGLHLRRGNSLVGARRALYSPDVVKKGEWLKSAPEEVPFRDGDIPEGYIHHWLLPAQGWGSVAGEKEAKNLAPEETAKLSAWRKSMRKRPKDGRGKGTQLKRLQGLSRRAEYLWGWVIRRLELSEQEISRHIKVYGADWIKEPENPLSRDEVKNRLERKGSPYWRLKTVMDAWCALWFWPVQKAGLLDGSDEVYGRLERSLEVSASGADALFDTGQRSSKSLADLDEWLDFAEAVLGSHDIPDDSLYEGQIHTLNKLEEAEDFLPGYMGMVEFYKLGEKFPWLLASEKLAEQYGFFHWELQFSHLFKKRGGFDIQVGNPPWVRPRWDEDSVIAESDPWFKLSGKASAESKAKRRKHALEGQRDRDFYLSELTVVSGLSGFLSSPACYPLLEGTQPDLYRAFMCRVWQGASLSGMSSLVHPDTHFGGAREVRLRREAYRRLRIHAHFMNVANWAFEDPISRTAEFGVHVYGAASEVSFKSVNWLFGASMVLSSLDGVGDDVPGLRHEGSWDLRSSGRRVVHVDQGKLDEWSRADGDGSQERAEGTPLLYPVSDEEDGVISAIGRYDSRLGRFRPLITRGFDEIGAKKSGLIQWDTSVPSDWSEVILQGPNFSQANLFSKRPNIPCRSQQDWKPWDLGSLGVGEIPVCNYRRSSERVVFDRSKDVWRGYPCSMYYRLAWRRMIPFNTERSLFASLIPLGASHVHAVNSMWVRDNRTTVLNSGFWASLPLDYLLRITGRSDLQNSEARKMPAPTPGHSLETALLVRTMRLNSLTNAYAPLWSELYDDTWREQTWAVNWEDLTPLQEVGPEWEYASPLRTERERRAALVELDALVSVWLGITADQLVAVYRSRYPVLTDYESKTWFDGMGRKVAAVYHTYGYGQTKQDYLDLQKYLETGNPAHIPSGYSAPFYKADREAEYREAHAYFTEIVERAKRDGTWNGES